MADPNANQDVRLQQNAAVSNEEHNAPVQQTQTHPVSSSMKPQEEFDPQGSTSHSALTNEPEHSDSAFTNESEPSHSALTNEQPEPPHSAFTNESEPFYSAFRNEPEYTQTHNHADVMVDNEDAAVESQEPLTSNTAAGRRNGYVRCSECLNTHLPPCNAPQEDKDLLQRDPAAYKRKFNTDRKKRNRKNRQAREPPPPVRGPSRVSRPAHASGARPGASTGRQYSTPPFPHLPSASPAARALITDIASTAPPDEVARIRASLARDPEDRTIRNVSHHFEHQLAQMARDAAPAEPTQE
jgi:hypothetical protein